ncbi:glycosyltransferase family 2 protein [Wenyingzhuangia sp. IMCC45467]
MIDNPLVSIVIPVYNRAHLISETLDSIMNQTYANWECIVVDDGSNDDSLLIINKYCIKDNRFKCYSRPSEKVKGANSCRNFGFEQSKGIYVNWFDSDDIMSELKLEKQVERLLKTEYNFTVCQTMTFQNSVGNTKGLRKDKVHSSNFLDDFITNEIKFLTQSPMFKRDFIELNKLEFDEKLHCSQERDFFVKSLALVDDYDFTEEVFVYFRINSEGISQSYKSIEKVKSVFDVEYNILLNNYQILSPKTKRYLLKRLISELNYSLTSKFYSLSRLFIKKLMSEKINLGFVNIIRLITSYISYRVIRKGYSLLPKL